VIIRKATAEDWAGTYPFFSAIVATGTMSPTLRAFRWRRLGRSGWSSLRAAPVVAAEGDTILGSAKMGPNRASRGSHVATASSMVDPPQAGRGVGRALGEHVLVWARSAGYRSMQFNAVVETNTGAVHLWQSFGFQILTTIAEAFDHHEHGLVGLHIIFQTLTEGEDADNAL